MSENQTDAQAEAPATPARLFQPIPGMGDAPRTTYALVLPITIGSKTVTELHFREPLTRDLFGVDLRRLDDAETFVKLAARLSGEFNTVLEKMGMVDHMATMELVAGFFPAPTSGPPTGPTPSA